MSPLEPRLRRGVWLTMGLSLIVMALIIGTHARETANVLRRADSLYLLGAMAAIILAWLMRALRLWVVARAAGRPVSPLRLTRIYLAACFAAHVTPFSSGGIPLQIFLLVREGFSYGTATAITVVDLGLTGFIFLILAPLFLILGGTLKGTAVLTVIPPLLGLAAFLGLTAILAFRKKDPDLLGWIQRHPRAASLFTRPRPARWLKKTDSELRQLRWGLSVTLKSGLSPVMGLVLYTVLYWTFFLAVAPLVLASLSQAFDWKVVMWRQMLINFLMPLVPTLGGSGGAEGLALWLFKGQARGAALGAFVVLWRFFTFYISLILGGLLLPGLLSQPQRYDTEGRPAERKESSREEGFRGEGRIT